MFKYDLCYGQGLGNYNDECLHVYEIQDTHCFDDASQQKLCLIGLKRAFSFFLNF